MSEKTLAVVGADVWPGHGPDMLPDQTIVAADGVITAVGPRESTPVPVGARVIDAAGKYVIPGLADAHVHLTTNADESHYGPWSQFLNERTVQEMALHGIRNGLRALTTGFTTLRVMGIRGAGEPELRDFTAKGLLPGPRLFVTPWWVSMTNGHGDLFYPKHHPRWEWDTADGPDQCRQLVRILAREGADFIKVMASGGLLSAGDKASWPNYTVEELKAIVDEAHAMDLKVAAHATGLAGLRRALEAGVDSIEHGTFLEEAEAAQMAETGTVLVPTLAITDAFTGDVGGVKPELAAKARAVVERHRSGFQFALDAGVKIAMGTDSGDHVAPFGEQAREFELYCEHGMKPYEALETATLATAELFDRTGELGLVAAGSVADLVVLEQNPLDDITALRAPGGIINVVKDGVDYTALLGLSFETEPLRVPPMN
ncbi:amidohydrolase family protein [Microbacter sp. GSS18]|nr:amidohydrolase family protein [Microbacter sp. GSS18]